ncbi:MAG: amino acid adenylation domain-containing protein, partial [Acidobacteria bacterium]|nr:amino acid adenylation domain-containing protein [Acidobacteriota bacterium]
LPPLTPAPRRGPIPVSFAQQRLWFIDQLEPGNCLYNICAMYRMRGELHVEALEKTINEIVRRHESLRTIFRSVDGQPVQVIAPELRVPLPVEICTGLLEQERESRIEQFAREQARQSFALETGPLLRFHLLELARDDHALMVVLHHIVGDGWSGGLLAAEMAALYEAFAGNRPSPLPDLAIQYADFAIWQRQWMKGKLLDERLAYWKNHLAGAPAVLDLPTDRPRRAVQRHLGAIESHVIGRKLLDQVRALGQAEGATLFMTLMSAFTLLLSRYSGQEDLVVGTPVAGRNYSEIESLIGFFVNTLALRTNLAGVRTFGELVTRVKEVALNGYAHQDIPFEKLVEELQPERSLSHNPIFQVLFGLQNFSKLTFDVPELRVERAPMHPGTSLFDMSWFAFEGSEGLLLRVEYDTDLFERATVKRMLGHFETLLSAVVEHPGTELGSLSILSGAEEEQMLREWNHTVVDYPLDRCLQEFIEAQVERTPDAPALIFGCQKLSYGELNSRANQLAHHLRKLGVQPDVLVGVCAHRSVEMVLALLATLKAGGTYVPLDPDYPRERLAVMIGDARPPVILTQEQLSPLLPETDARIICLDRDWGKVAAEASGNPSCITTRKNLAYAIYTSGSTGKPKGVLNVHEGIVNRLLWMQDTYQLGPSDRVLQKTPFSFDVSVWEFFWPLMTGACLVLTAPDAHKDPSYLVEIIEREQITTIHFVPSMLQMFLEEKGRERCPSLRRVFSSGEALSYELQQRFSELCQAELHNLYGPTEAAVDVTYWRCRSDQRRPIVPIGRPIANTQIYLLDKNLQPVPVGVPGELFIGGVALARGYLNRPELTAEKFIPDPFSSRPGARLYRTGDLARFGPDGNIEYLRRLDHQVKIRGFRIELGEIEALLAEHPAVDDCVVLVREDVPGDRKLAAYVVLRSGQNTPAPELRDWVKNRLPAYMVPQAVVELESFPLTTSGKVDRNALPAPALRDESDSYDVGRTLVEEEISLIWSEVLRVNQVRRQDDFFELGGHSLLAAQVISRIRQTLNVEIPLRAIFESPSLAGLAEWVEGRLRAGHKLELPALRRVSRDQVLPLSSAQQRLWFLDQLDPHHAVYNIPGTYRLEGGLDRDILARSLESLTARHESLRTTFVAIDGRPAQVIAPSTSIPIEWVDFTHLPSDTSEQLARERITSEARHPFDLAHGPLLRITVAQLAGGAQLLSICIHHIISDRWSVGVLLRDLLELYEAHSSATEARLPALTVQYADYAAWQKEITGGEGLRKQVAYWAQELKDAPPVLELPTDRPRPAFETYSGDIVSIDMSKELTGKLIALSRAQGTTLFMTLLAAFQVLLARYSGQHDILLGVPFASRRYPEIENLIGLFASTLPLRARLAGNPTFVEILKQAKQQTLAAYAHQDAQFEKLVEELAPERSLSHSPLVQVYFILQNAPMQGLRFRGRELKHVPTYTATSKGDLFCSLVERENSLGGVIEYKTELFDRTTIERLLAHYQVLLEAVVGKPSLRLSELPLLPQAEHIRIIEEWNATKADYPRQQRVHELFEQQVERRADTVAVKFGDQQLSYAQLNAQANQLAHYLVGRGMGPGERIGIYLERSLDLMVALLAVQKAGAAYVPLDPDYPGERIHLILEDADLKMVISQRSLTGSLPRQGQGLELLSLDAHRQAIERESTANLATVAGQAEDLMYVIFTSGSTGRPKGVQVPHRAVVNLLTYMKKVLNIG